MQRAEKPIFHDPEGKRWPRVKRFGGILLLISSIIGSLLCVTILLFPMLDSTANLGDRQYVALPHAVHVKAERRMLAEQARWALVGRIHREAISTQLRALHGQLTQRIVVGFYVNWETNSFDSLRQHIDALSYVMPEWATITADGRGIRSLFSKDTHDPDALKLASAHHVPIIPIVNNIDATGFRWEPLRQLLSDRQRQQTMVRALHSYVMRNHFAGVNIDFEIPYNEVPDKDLPLAHRLAHDELPHFIALLKLAFSPDHLLVTQDLQAADKNLDYERLAELNDFVVIMLYDQHVPSGDAGPIAGQDWVESRVDTLLKNIDGNKVVLGLANYCYDWPVRFDAHGNITTIGTGRKLLLGAALSIAHQAGATIQMDDGDLNPYFTYQDSQGHDHLVYLLDAVTLLNELNALRGFDTRGAALWYLGSEDPTIWSFFRQGRLDKPHAPQQLARVNFRDMVSADVDWNDNELMKIAALPQDGERRFTVEADGTITGERYVRYPSPYLADQFGTSQKVVALTFDDGPDPVYTPQILRILREHHVNATFFVIGESAAKYANLVRESWRDGNEIGNHTYTHPHIMQVSNLRAEMEMNATERVIESITGHSSLLFRPPFGDSPDSGALSSYGSSLLKLLHNAGYIVVGMNIDPKDYLCPPPHIIVQRVDKQLGNNHIILLHDSGGNRRNTVAALPRIIDDLQRKGYRFVTVSQLMGAHAKTEIFPVADPTQHHIALFDGAVFKFADGVVDVLVCCFIAGIILGILRLIVFGTLIIKQRRRFTPTAFDAKYTPFVSVIVPAYNEGKVVCRTVASVLAGVYDQLEVIAVDDGSTDDTYARLLAEFADDERVTVLTKENGGKATALNLAIARARGEIVVCIDADTILDRNAVRCLVRQFVDPHVGAVAGNVKVGNRINALTIWQSLEYVTSQNFDRQAFAALNSVPVIPGAIGAWRRDVVLQAGGFEANTLAEDTDLTFRVRMLGYHTRCDNQALAYTEAPDTLHALARQRFRWSFGILQALWKHRRELLHRRGGAFSMVVMPSMWIYNFALQALAPFVDLSVLYMVLTGDLLVAGYYLAAFFVLDIVTSYLAVALDGEDRKMLLWLFWQRFVYREFMYYIIYKSLVHALRGNHVGWGKLQRKATVSLPEGE